MLVKRFKLKEIKEYEENNGVSILSLFEDQFSDNSVVELIKLGNGNCCEEMACQLLDAYLNKGNNLVDAFVEIKECLLGKTLEEGNEAGIKTSDYANMTALYTELCMQLMSVGVGYSEFWEMSTSDMYRVFDSIMLKIKTDMNRQYSIAHTQAGMIGAAVWGKLGKEPPKVELENESNKVVNIDGLGKVDKQTASSVLALQALLNKNKKKGVEK